MTSLSLGPAAAFQNTIAKAGIADQEFGVVNFASLHPMEELVQRVSATLKKYLNKDFDWDSQRYRLASRN